MGPAALQLLDERVKGVRRERAARQDRLPGLRGLRHRKGDGVGRVEPLERTALGRVPLEVGRVHLDAVDRPSPRQFHDRPVVARPATAPRFPAVVHSPGRTRQDQVVAVSEEHVARRQHHPAVLERGQVEIAAAREAFQVGEDYPVNAQARDTAVGKDVQPDVRRAAPAADLEGVLAVSAQCRPRQNLFPAGGRERLRRGVARQLARLERAGVRVVALEVARVDDDAVDRAGKAQADQAPVVSRRAPAPRLPAVHPLAPVGVLVLAEDRPLGLDEVLLAGEELVVGGDRRAAQALRSEIRKVGESGHRDAFGDSRISPDGRPTNSPFS